jgi:peptidoglycan/LPS O-acetylase OafA/YrhL
MLEKNEVQRFYFLDNIKVFLTMLVIIHHVGQAYGPTGGFWQYQSSLGESISTLGSFFGVNAAFFMSFFFLISGYFLPMSYDRNNGKYFIQKRLLKYGIPLLFVFLIVQPLQMYFYYSLYSGNNPLSFSEYYSLIFFGVKGIPEGFISVIGFPEMNFGHAWFLEHLLVYAILYWLFRAIFKKPLLKMRNKPFTALHILIITIVMAVSTSIVRIWYPIDDWKGILGVFQVEIAHWTQYLIMFIVGLTAYRKNWLNTLETKTGYVSLIIGILLTVIVYTGVPVWEIWNIYDSFLAVSLIFGFITLFREKFNKTSRFLKKLSRSSYAVYILHYPIVLSIQYLFDKVVIGGAVGKFITVSIISIVLTYMAGILLIKIKLLKNIL